MVRFRDATSRLVRRATSVLDGRFRRNGLARARRGHRLLRRCAAGFDRTAMGISQIAAAVTTHIEMHSELILDGCLGDGFALESNAGQRYLAAAR